MDATIQFFVTGADLDEMATAAVARLDAMRSGHDYVIDRCDIEMESEPVQGEYTWRARIYGTLLNVA